MRKLATIEEIAEVKEHPNADLLELAIIKGWQCVVKKGEFSSGDKVIYCEIDSWIPHSIAPFLTRGKDTPKEYEGIKGQRLSTIKLRGKLSQGLVLPTSLLPEKGEYGVGDDIAETLGILKWEPPIPACLGGQVAGGFPTRLVRKTDQERIQNLFDDLNPNDSWEITIKIDGSSMTLIKYEGQVRVCSRNWELKMNEENAHNTLVTMATKLTPNLESIDNYAFQGELFGEGIQSNKEKIKGHRFAIFDIYNIDEKRYLDGGEREELCQQLGLEHVPIIARAAPTPKSIEAALKQAEGRSINAKVREGIVYKSLNNPNHSFKVISNKFLLKHNE